MTVATAPAAPVVDSPDSNGDSSAKNHLFICGVPRSGTTALAALLNHHSDIFVGVERYKNLPRGEFGPELFTAARFFEKRPTDTNIALSVDQKAQDAFAKATWVGDKVPRYYASYGVLLKRFPESKILYIVRDIHDVADSWNRRAANPADRWPAHNDYRRAVVEWNSSLKTTIETQRENPSRFIIVKYETLFSGDVAVLNGVLRQLNLEPTPHMLRFFQGLTAGWGERVKRKEIKNQEQWDYLQAHADWGAFETLSGLAISGAAARIEVAAAAEKTAAASIAAPERVAVSPAPPRPKREAPAIAPAIERPAAPKPAAPVVTAVALAPADLTVAAIGSCRIYKPLRRALGQGQLGAFTNLFPHVHNPMEIWQAFNILKGKVSPPADLLPWINLKGARKYSAKAYENMTKAARLFVIELSSIRLVTYDGWQLQINAFRENLTAEGVPAGLTNKLHGPAEISGPAREEILALPISDLAKAIIAKGEFREMTAAEIAALLPKLLEAAGRPTLFVGFVQNKATGAPIEQRVLLNNEMATFAENNQDAAFFNPTELIARFGFETVMKDLGHYKEAFEKPAGKVMADVLLEFAGKLAAAAPAQATA